MKFGLITRTLHRFACIGVAALAVCTMVSCGGGGGSPGTKGIGEGTASESSSSASSLSASLPSTAGKINIVLTDATGAVSNAVTGSNSLIAKATVTDKSGAPVKNILVTFTVSSNLATLSPASGTALTDNNGVAQVGLKSGGNGSGAAEVSATATVGDTKMSEKAAFSVGAAPTTTPTAINFVSASPSDNSIVIKGSGGNGRTEVALLTFRVVDSSNSGVPNIPVTFATQSTNPVTLVSNTGTTDANGSVTVAVNSGIKPTTVSVIATVQGTTISAISGQVTVTTGQPTQTAFSLALEKFYVEGLNFDNTQNTVTALLADEFGGAVADGTQVVFITDSGAIVGNGGAKCLTVQGKCTVTWRSQNPRGTTGVGNILATATNGTANLSANQNFYYSGSFATVYHVTGSAGATTRLSAGGPITLSFAASCTPQAIMIELVDINGNPMPEGTVISGVNATNASISVSPSIVGFAGMWLDSTTRGTVHNLTVSPSGCSQGGANTKTGFIDVSVKTPLGRETFTRIDLGAFPST